MRTRRPDPALDADVVVVGGGIAGISVAYELAAHRSVVVLEQEPHLAHHATGRSAAAFLESYGSPEIRLLTSASRAFFEEPGGDDDVPELLHRRPLLWVGREDQGALIDDLCTSQPRLQRLDAAEARAACSALDETYVAAAALEDTAMGIDVAAFHDVYVHGARRRGVRVVPGSALLGGQERGGAWRIHASGLELTARVIVNAAGAWADVIAARLGAATLGLSPMRRTIAVGRPSVRAVVPEWPLVTDVAEQFYFRPEGPNVLLSPADETPSEACDARPEEADVALGIARVNSATTLEVRSVVAAWSGLRTFAVDRNPVIGFDPVVTGLFWLAGQGGFGIQTAPALARLGASLVLEQPLPTDLVASGLDVARLDPSRLV